MSLNSGSILRLPEPVTIPRSGPAGTHYLYFKSDGVLYTTNNSGTESAIGPSSGPTAADLNDRDTLFWMGV